MRDVTAIGLALTLGAGLAHFAVERHPVTSASGAGSSPIVMAISLGGDLVLAGTRSGASTGAMTTVAGGSAGRRVLACSGVVGLPGWGLGFDCGQPAALADASLRK